ncbi:hypothetical protein [Phenylobacterium sp.]
MEMDLRFVEMKKAMTVLCRRTAKIAMGLGATGPQELRSGLNRGRVAAN